MAKSVKIEDWQPKFKANDAVMVVEDEETRTGIIACVETEKRKYVVFFCQR